MQPRHLETLGGLATHLSLLMLEGDPLFLSSHLEQAPYSQLLLLLLQTWAARWRRAATTQYLAGRGHVPLNLQHGKSQQAAKQL